MKIFGHPLHVMFIHFPVGLLPMEFILSMLGYFYGSASFLTAAFYALIGAVATGYMAMATGLLDLAAIPRHEKSALGTGLLHGFINGSIILVYSILAYKSWHHFPQLELPTAGSLALKAVLIFSLFSGNFLGGKLIYNHHIGIQKIK